MATTRVCSTPGCPNFTDHGGRCATCTAKADQARRPKGNPYSSPGHQRFREQVLARDPICVVCLGARATVADHYPHDRVDLIDMGLDPNDPRWGRGLCARCHNKHTAASKPAGALAPHDG